MPLHRIVIVLAVLVGLSLLIPLLPLPDPLLQDPSGILLPPGSANHPLGTDELGRDLLSRALNGLSMTLWVSVAALVSSLALGTLLGGIAGFFSGSGIDHAFNWIVNLVLSLPFLLIMVAVLSLTEPGLVKAYAVLAGVMWIHPARIVRSEVARRRSLAYILAARAMGVSEWHIFWRKLIPRSLAPAVVFAYTYLPEFIALEAGLSFLGLGVQPPNPGLGKMIFDGLPYLSSAWWLSLFPAAMLFIVVLLINISEWKARR